jgi:hypothetical protein
MAGELSDVTMARRRSLVRDRSFASTTPSTTPARRLPVGLRAVGLIAERSAPAAVEEHATRSVPDGPAPVGWPGARHVPSVCAPAARRASQPLLCQSSGR